jgi:hypothetical protein
LVRQLEGLLRPWMSLEVLVRTERHILADLAARAREGALALGVAPAPQSRMPVLLILLVVAALVLVVLAGRGEPLRAASAGRWSDAARQWLHTARASLQAVPGLWAGCLGVLAIVLAPLLWRRRA